MNHERCTANDLCDAKPGHFGSCDVSPHANAVLAEARRVSADNADIALDALRMLEELQKGQKLA